eukprot:CAMPEP_0116872484 /NCGR_PEP_ID=MMETSP0463-20121206/3249_1 /TAXON_ID=181622 /ORGANISM="Strombidinopsis sp, Strain SopsisLIS2011" /LENGTH=30 /DNA_ID= /DNA_START= /DNA_END= /DNA_ORIENTATION=
MTEEEEKIIKDMKSQIKVGKVDPETGKPPN